MASTCPGGVLGTICSAVQHIQLPEGGVSVGQITHAAGSTAGKAASTVTGDVLGQIAQAMASAADGLLKTLSTFWMNVDTPQLDVSGSPVSVIKADTSWIVTVTAIICILVAAGRMAIRRRGEPAAAMLLGLARLVVVSGVATVTVEAAGKLGDAFSASLMSSAHLGANGWSAIINTAALSAAVAPGFGMLLIIALLIIFSSLIQLMLMILRVGLMIILAGTLPLAAAASMSEWGQTWWRKHLGWLTAWLLYKPAAALLYAAAFALTNGHRTAVEVISGFMLLILSVLILPALLKVIVPMTAHLGAASSGALAMGAAGAAATGAIKVAAFGGTGGAAAAAPSGNPAPSGGQASGPDKAGLSAPGSGPRGSSPDFHERPVVQLSGKRSAPGKSAAGADAEPFSAGAAFDAAAPRPAAPRIAARSSTEMPPDTNASGPGGAGDSGTGSSGAAHAPSTGHQPTGSASQPAGSASLGGNVADAGGPSGAIGHGDDQERGNGG